MAKYTKTEQRPADADKVTGNYVETAKELYSNAGIVDSKQDRPYLTTSVWRHTASRLPWLIGLVFALLIAGVLITFYEESFMKMPILVAFIPMLMGIAGAGGSQSATVIVRALAIGEITTKQYLRAFWKEARISVLCGAAIGLFGLVYILLTENGNWLLGSVLMLTLLATIIFAKLLGMLLPIGAKKVRIDPALISSPFVTIIADIFAIWVYFSFAQMILGI